MRPSSVLVVFSQVLLPILVVMGVGYLLRRRFDLKMRSITGSASTLELLRFGGLMETLWRSPSVALGGDWHGALLHGPGGFGSSGQRPG